MKNRWGLGVRHLCSSWGVLIVALAARLSVVWWASGRVPPTADGEFYHIVAQRIAAGEGYTWLWPDGAVTYAAHYPVGYPSLLGVIYFLVGPHPTAAMVMNAFLGAAGPVAIVGVCREALAASPFRRHARWASCLAGFMAALMPSLVLYTPAVMTEGAVASVVAVAARVAVALRAQGGIGKWAALGLLMGFATLIRPQSILLAPLLGIVATRRHVITSRLRGNDLPGTRTEMLRRAAGGGFVLALALLVCLPWTLRNCDKMDRCLFVSANAGWNLLIGTFPEGEGAWVPLQGERVPSECRTVFQEAEKDQCFGRAGLRRVLNRPWSWLAQIPAKWRQTFDFTAAAANHLREAGAIDQSASRALTVFELVTQRLAHVLAAVGVAGVAWSRWAFDEKKRTALVSGLLFIAILGFAGWAAWVGWGAVLVLTFLGRGLFSSVGIFWGVGALVTTALVHGAFFGAGRYFLPLVLWTMPLTALGLGAFAALGGQLRARANGSF